jgi:hypothetical protein
VRFPQAVLAINLTVHAKNNLTSRYP